MKLMRTALVAVLVMSVSGCAALDVATRNATVDLSKDAQKLGQIVEISDVQVHVPQSLEASEAELYYPTADIVWRGDAPGDRHQQVKSIFETSAISASADLSGQTKARLEIDVQRFHALTNKARYTVGGTHSINFVLSLKDPVTGVDMIEPRQIKAEFPAYGGQDAVEADARGETQKNRITAHLSKVIRTQLAESVGGDTTMVSRNVAMLPATADEVSAD
ncbi:hypothetical protein KO498_03310 [Lentibacter algarum]|uniref:DUF6778 family protein n=1 Tax=Lentibacter algarum TaxID=576131 RepID=UPI001C065E83|nr:DUF6778 family protein [Lentibacter algarum]MBU2980834.1 hypothetical protein [Lentibacter algarum]